MRRRRKQCEGLEGEARSEERGDEGGREVEDGGGGGDKREDEERRGEIGGGKGRGEGGD